VKYKSVREIVRGIRYEFVSKTNKGITLMSHDSRAIAVAQIINPLRPIEELRWFGHGETE